MHMRSLPLVMAFLISIAAIPAWTSASFQTLENCRLKPSSGNDGDSFHVLHKDKEYVFRLYFVDSPESSWQVPRRVFEQTRYFGVDKDTVIEAGKMAARFTREKLADRPFTVVTAFEDAKGASSLGRSYAFVLLEDDTGLAELLVKNGLARVYGVGARQPRGKSQKNRRAELERLEKRARDARIGIWKSSNL